MNPTDQPGTDGPPLALLRRIASARPTPPDYERCELCGEPIPDEHRHVVNLASRNLMCSCRPCTLLFAYDEAQLRYRAVPEDYRRFTDLPAAVWDELQIPVGLVFLFRNSSLDSTVAFYPGPAGATESELPLGAWDALVATRPELALGRPDVEALLLRAPDGDGIECYLVPIDRCYELVGRLRLLWRGFDGGQQARAELDGFFADLAARAQPAAHRLPP
jgi:Family of unknown function (DUF5947)